MMIRDYKHLIKLQHVRMEQTDEMLSKIQMINFDDYSS